jgi:hypothetical protein
MTTKRTPIKRQPEPKITPAAIRLFEHMRRIRCSCPPIDWAGEYWNRDECSGCKRWWRLHRDLVGELQTAPWQYPVIEDPTTQNPYPPGTLAHLEWKPKLEAQARWLLLAEASREARREAERVKAARKAAAPTV